MVSEIGFGASTVGGSGWGKQDENDSIEALHTAIDNGLNFIDTAQIYGKGKGEEIISRIIKERKEKIYVCTKTPPLAGSWPPSHYDNPEKRFPEDYLKENVDERCKALGVESLDVLLLHTWTRAWNKDPKPLMVLDELRKKGKIKWIGVSTPEHDQNGVIDLMKNGLIDVVELIFNIFEQEPAAELLPAAKEYNIGVVGRVPLDEGSLTGKYTIDTTFQEGDFRKTFFKGDRLAITLEKIDKIKEEIKDEEITLIQAAIKFILAREEISTVIPGMRNSLQAKENTSISDLPPLSEKLISRLKQHYWLCNLARYF
jgi:aryl-alcohol dehydrogenase-like predicted oxidoreductase